MEHAGIRPDSLVQKRLDSLLLRLRRRQLIGSHSVAVETVKLLRDVVASCKVTSFDALLELVEEVGARLSEAGRKEPVIKNMVLRVLKFLREEYQTALTSAIAGITGSTANESGPGSGSGSAFQSSSQLVQTPGSVATTPFAAFPLDTSAIMPGMARQDSSFPFYRSSSAASSTGAAAANARSASGSGGTSSPISRTASIDEMSSLSKRTANMSMESISHTPSLAASSSASQARHPSQPAAVSGMQPIGTSSMFELLGHRPEKQSAATAAAISGLASMRSSMHSPQGGSGYQTPISANPSTPLDSPSSPPTQHHPHHKAPAKPANLRQGSTNAVAFAVQTHPTLQKMEEDFSKKSGRLKPVFIDAITDLLDELGMVREHIAAQATEHIHSAEIILTLGHSESVEAFLKAAGRKRKITVVVAETAPSYSGRTLALSLSSAGIPTLLVPDSAVYSLMSRVSKVILGTHIVHADGSLVAVTGSLPMAKAAKAHNVPVVVVTGMFKVSNDFTYAGETGTLLEELDNATPAEILRTHHALLTPGGSPEEDTAAPQSRSGVAPTATNQDEEDFDLDALVEKCEIVTPYWDRVPQELVTLFITNIGAHPSSMIFRLLKELFE